MTLRSAALAAALILSSTVTAYAGCRAHSDPVMSCAEGATYDADTRTCVVQTTG